MRKNYLQLSAVASLLLSSAAAQALPFDSFDPRSMSMGGTGVAVGDPSTAPFFNPAMLTASDPSKKYSIELPIIGVRLYDPSNMHTNLTTLADTGTLLTNNASTLSTNSTAFSNSITTLNSDISTMSTRITSLGNLSVTDAATAATALTSMNTLSSNLTTVTTDISSVSTTSGTVSTNTSTVSSNISSINTLLNKMNNQPIQGVFGAATVVGIPGKNWGFAFYANAWGAVGGTLEYRDSATVTTITNALNTTSTALGSTSTATGNASTDLSTANTKLTTAISDCAASKLTTAAALTTCSNSLTAAQSSLNTAKTTMGTTSTTIASNATSVTDAASSVKGNTTLQSKIHLRGVAVVEEGLSMSHNFVTYDHTWSLGITPKVMNLTLFDALLGASNGTSTSGITGNDYIATYNTVNFDLGVAKSYNNGWRSGVMVKNVIPQSFDFKNAPTPGATPVANGSSLTLNPQARFGISHDNAWSTVAFDVDMTRNNPAGLENQSQYAGIGGELSAWGWAQLRAGYRSDLLNAGQEVISMGFGISPRIPYFKPHLDLAIIASKDILTSGWNNATQVGASLKAGLNF